MKLQKNNQDSIGYLYREIGNADDKYIEEMLDDRLAGTIKKNNLRKRRLNVLAYAAVFAAVCAAAAFPILHTSLKTDSTMQSADAGFAPETAYQQDTEQPEEDVSAEKSADEETAIPENNTFQAEDLPETDAANEDYAGVFDPQTLAELSDEYDFAENLHCDGIYETENAPEYGDEEFKSQAWDYIFGNAEEAYRVTDEDFQAAGNSAEYITYACRLGSDPQTFFIEVYDSGYVSVKSYLFYIGDGARQLIDDYTARYGEIKHYNN